MAKITDLYFPAKRWDFNTRQFEDYNLFGSLNVLCNVATWVKATKSKNKTISDKFILEEYKDKDRLIFFLFGDLWSHVEYEFVVKDGKLMGGLFEDVEGEKTDIYQMYVLPNKNKLLKLIDTVTLTSAVTFLRGERRRRRG